MLNIARINLITLRKNAKNIKSKLNNGVKFCAVVKADAYGHGAPTVANAVYDIVDCFAVALVEEGISLRRSGIDKDILVLSPINKKDMESAIYNQLTLTVDSKTQILELEKIGKKLNKKVNVHLKFNVGMNRFGVDTLDELKELLEVISAKKQVILQGMYSHLPCPQNKKLLKTAENKFLLANNLVKGYNNKAVCHLSASGGLLTGCQFDMVRVGILLYGYKPFPSDKIKVSPVMKVFSPVVKTRRLCAGDSALYGDVKLKEPKNVCLIRFGYADGLDRACVNGQINNRCMDVTMLEAGDVKNGVWVMDDAEKLAKQYKTIPYEILCKISMRAEKIYLR